MPRVERVLLVQPPFTQINAPYPAIWFLKAWLERRGFDCAVADHSIRTTRSMLSREGVTRVFELADARLARIGFPAAEPERSQVLRYLSDRERWIESVPAFAALLSGQDPALDLLAGTARPFAWGSRAESSVESAETRGEPIDPRVFASRALADWTDFVSYAVDPSFSLARYAAAIASSARTFDPVLDALRGSVVLPEFYGPLLDRWLDEVAPPGRFLVCLSIPFPGTLLGALFACERIKTRFGDRAAIAIGGGYISTELRGLKDARIFRFCDYLVFDSGFGALQSILKREEAGAGPLHSTAVAARLGDPPGAEIVLHGMPRLPTDAPDDARIARIADPADARFAAIDAEAVRDVAPDYAGLDARACVRVRESGNPMHDLWSDSVWLKQRLAHGCYWRKCSFCDTDLDYVRGYSRCAVESVARASLRAMEGTGLRGVHFVDEAMPAASLVDWALLVRRAGAKPAFWGNVRWDRSWTRDRCLLLADSGMVAASGGLEAPTEKGLGLVGKGSSLEDMVRALRAFKTAGMLTHGYLMYGIPGQEDRDIADSAEVARQLFACGLLDSCFWHRFVLTRHSTMNRERLAGKRPDLRAIDPPFAFAGNDLGFEGSARFDAWDEPLDALALAWHRGESLSEPVAFRLGRRSVAADVDPGLVAGLLAEDTLASASGPSPGARAFWLGGAPLVRPDPSPALEWANGAALQSARLPAGTPLDAAESLARALGSLPGGARHDASRFPLVEAAAFEAAVEGLVPGLLRSRAWKIIRELGLVYA